MSFKIFIFVDCVFIYFYGLYVINLKVLRVKKNCGQYISEFNKKLDQWINEYRILKNNVFSK